MIEVRVPDIGDFDEVDVVEVLVEPGARVEADEALIVLESEKASMDVPAPSGGVVKEVAVKVGDKVGEGALIVTIEEADEGASEGEDAGGKAKDKGKEKPVAAPPKAAGGAKAKSEGEEESASAESAEDEAAAEDTEAKRKAAAKATSDAGKAAEKKASADDEGGEPKPRPGGAPSRPPAGESGGAAPPDTKEERPTPPAHASPSVRRFARELGVDVAQVEGTGPKGRITREDVQAFVKKAMTATREGTATATGPAPGSGIPPMPSIDFSKFGEIEEVPLSRIRQRSKDNLHRAWLNIAQVTQHDTADITELEAFRKAQSAEAQKLGFKLTPLAFLMKAAVTTLKVFPRVNSSLAPSGKALIYKKYWHLGIAVDTKDGLVVPVIRDVDKKSVYDLAEELAEVSARARDGKLGLGEVSGASFTITSLGGYGGSFFTPIVNAPEVAILGVARHRMEPVWQDDKFVPRLILPLSLSYDHRVVDGAEAVRFTTYLAGLLGDIRRLLL